jgi:hypothetical protein
MHNEPTLYTADNHDELWLCWLLKQTGLPRDIRFYILRKLNGKIYCSYEGRSFYRKYAYYVDGFGLGILPRPFVDPCTNERARSTASTEEETQSTKKAKPSI